MKKYHDKLVRDRIPQIISESGQTPYSFVLSEDAYKEALLAKFAEEVSEFSLEPSAEELADILEVLQATAEAWGIAWKEVLEAKEHKRSQRGGFSQRIYLQSVGTDETEDR